MKKWKDDFNKIQKAVLKLTANFSHWSDVTFQLSKSNHKFNALSSVVCLFMYTA